MDRKRSDWVTPTKKIADEAFESVRSSGGSLGDLVTQVFNWETAQAGPVYRTEYGVNPIYARLRSPLSTNTVPGLANLYGKRIYSITGTLVAFRDPSNLEQFNVVKMGTETLWFQKTNMPNVVLSNEVQTNNFGFFILDGNVSTPVIWIDCPFVFQVNNVAVPPGAGTDLSVQVVAKVAIQYAP